MPSTTAKAPTLRTRAQALGPAQVANLVLKRGYTQDDTLWQWYQRIANGVDDRRTAAWFS